MKFKHYMHQGFIYGDAEQRGMGVCVIGKSEQNILLSCHTKMAESLVRLSAIGKFRIVTRLCCRRFPFLPLQAVPETITVRPAPEEKVLWTPNPLP